MDGKTVSDFELLVFAFAMGLATSGLVASAVGAFFGAGAGFHPPFVMRRRLIMSLAIVALAGPVMLFNDLFHAMESGALGPLRLGAGLFVSIVWITALGILITELAWRVGILVA